MAKIFSQLENAQAENKTSDYSVGTLGRFWIRSNTKKVKIDRGDIIAEFLLNDDKLIIGSSGTAANNSRLYRDANNRLSFVKGSEATAEGSPPVDLAELASRLPNYTNGSKPASSLTNPGRIIWLTDLLKAQIDTGSTWLDIGGGGSAVFQWNVNGPLSLIGSTAKRVDGSILYQSLTPAAAKLTCKRTGTSGTLDVDVRTHQSLNAPISSIASLFSAAISSITAPLASIATQSIARHTAQISTQSISRAKSTLNIQSIIKVQGTDQWKYNLTGALLDSDYSIGSSVLIAGATSGANNGTFVITDVNNGNNPSITVTNAAGVAQAGIAGTLDLQLWSYNYASAVSTDYVAGDSVLTAAHTTGANDGTFTLYKVNQGGNNFWIYNASGVVQAGVAGNANNFLWRYSYAALANATYFVVGESAKFAGHTTGANNGNFPIRFINSGGNNIVVYNSSGVAQAGVAGNALPNRWNINFGTDPSAIISAQDSVRVEGSGTAVNNGLWVAKIIVTNTVTVYDTSFAMAAQGASGTGYHTKYKLTLFVDPATLSITTASRLELKGTPTTAWEETDLKIGYQVLAVGAMDVTFVDTAALLADIVSSPAGFIAIESKSIFSARPTIAAGKVGLFEKELQTASATVIGAAIAANTWLGVWVMSNFTAGLSKDFSLTLY